jgi:hypothetical protein
MRELFLENCREMGLTDAEINAKWEKMLDRMILGKNGQPAEGPIK